MSFDHRDLGTPASAWTALRCELPRDVLVSAHDHVLVLAAHPDDETLGAGGLVADAARAGAEVTIVIATDGRGSHPASGTHTPDDLARMRTCEAGLAASLLAPHSALVQLGFGDGELGELREELTNAVTELAGTATVIATTWRHDGHPDHDVCGEVAAAVCATTGLRLLEFPIWAWHWGQPGRSGPLLGEGWLAQPVSEAARAAKAAALDEYRSQLHALSDNAGDEPVVTPALLSHCTADHEVFRHGEPADLPARYFERLYEADPDPWKIEAGFYEARKRELVLASLPRARFRSGFEPGCAGGLLTVELAARCERLTAFDVTESAVHATRRRTRGRPGVSVRVAAVPDEWPDAPLDLIVVSELGYYLAAPDELATRVRDSLTDDGVVVACHWRHPAPGYPSSARAVHDALGRGLHHLVTHVEPDFLLDVWTRRPGSVAATHGVLR